MSEPKSQVSKIPLMWESPLLCHWRRTDASESHDFVGCHGPNLSSLPTPVPNWSLHKLGIPYVLESVLQTFLHSVVVISNIQCDLVE